MASTLRLFRLLLLGASILAIGACKDAPPRDAEELSIRFVPKRLTSTPTADIAAAFDGDPTTTISLTQQVSVRIELSSPAELSAVKAFGAQGLELEFPPFIGVLGPSTDGWERLFTPTSRIAEAVLVLKPTNQRGVIGEIELWGRPGTPAPREPSVLAATAFAGVMPAFDNAVIAAADIPGFKLRPRGFQGGDDCKATRIRVPAYAVPFARRAHLLFEATGIDRAAELSFALNASTPLGGFWLGGRGESQILTQELPAAELDAQNQLVICLPPEAAREVEIRRLHLALLLDDGTFAFDRDAELSLGTAGDGIVDTAKTFRSGRVEFGFDSPVAVDAIDVRFEQPPQSGGIEIMNGAGSWSRQPFAEFRAGWNKLETDGAPSRALAFELSGVARADVPAAAIAEVRVSGSPADKQTVRPHLHVTYPKLIERGGRLIGERFGDKAVVVGWARSPSGPGMVEVQGVAVGNADGMFSTPIERPAAQRGTDASWRVTLVARFPDGTSVTREVFLDDDRESEVLGGGAATGPTDADRRFGKENSTAWGRVDAERGGKVTLGTDVHFEAPAGAVNGPVSIGIHHGRPEMMPPLDPGMINVTAPANRGYRFLPKGQQFKAPVKVTLPYDASLLPDGIAAEEIHTYFFDEELQQWQRLPRSLVNRANAQIVSETTHFTFMINAIMVLPEHAGPASFNPTSLKDLKAAVPSTNIDFIEPPAPTWNGSANVSFPIRLPPARSVYQPNLTISYSSTAGNGWLGVGWNLGASTIAVDTNFGVPYYDSTDRYVLDGSQLVPDGTATCIGGGTGKRYRERAEGAFKLIIRCGTNAASYHFQVIDKLGTLFVYGLTDGSRLKSYRPGTPIALWHLERVIDANDNLTYFEYDIDRRDPGAGGEDFRQTYLSRVYYSGRLSRLDASAVNPSRPTNIGTYYVELQHQKTSSGALAERPDVITSARLGFKTLQRRRLGTIGVWYTGEGAPLLVREYQLSYESGDFGKSRLTRIAVYGAGGIAGGHFFYDHEFDYWDASQVHPGTEFTAPVPWMFDDGIDPVDTSPGDRDQAGLSTSSEMSLANYFYLGVGAGWTKSAGSVGVSATLSSRNSTTESMLIDVNGDGLPDRVTYKDGSLAVRLNNGTAISARTRADDALAGGLLLPFFPPQPFTLGSEYGQSFGGAIEGAFAGFSASVGMSFNMSRASEFVLDADGDGLFDVVDDGKVLFNQLRLDNPFCDPSQFCFAATKLGRELPLDALNAGYDELANDPVLVQARAAMQEKIRPVDALLEWIAPYEGHIDVSGALSWRTPNPGAGPPRDGVRVRVYWHRPDLATPLTTKLGDDQVLPANAVDPVQVARPQVAVKKGDRLYFLLSTLQDYPVDSSVQPPQPLEDVAYAPILQYTDCLGCGAIDTNLRDATGARVFVFSTATDVKLAGGPVTGVLVPRRGRIRIDGIVHKEATSDHVRVCVQKFGRSEEIQDRGCGWFEPLSKNLDANTIGDIPVTGEFDVEQGEQLVFRLESDFNIDPDDLTWSPSGAMKCLKGPDPFASCEPPPENQPGLTFVGEPYFKVRTNISGKPLRAYVVPHDGKLTIESDAENGFIGGPVYVARTEHRLLMKHGDDDLPSKVGPIDVAAGTPIYFETNSAPGAAWGVKTVLEYTDNEGKTVKLTTTPTTNFVYEWQWGEHEYRSPFGGGHHGFRYGVWRGKDGVDTFAPELFYAEAEIDFGSGSEQERFRRGRDMLRDPNSDAYKRANLFAPMFPKHYGTRLTPTDPGLYANPAFVSSDATAYFSRSGIVHAGRQGGATSGGGSGEVLFAIGELARMSNSWSLSGGLNLPVAGLGLNFSGGRSGQKADVRDMNGDGIIDVVIGGEHGTVTLTNPASLSVRHAYAPSSGILISDNSDFGFSAGLGGGMPITELTVKGRIAGTTSQMPANGILGGGFGANFGVTEHELQDVNGDGLADQVSYDKQHQRLNVRLNLGTAFASEVDHISMASWSLDGDYDPLIASLRGDVAEAGTPGDPEEDAAYGSTTAALDTLSKPDVLKRSLSLSLSANGGAALEENGVTMNLESSLNQTEVMLADVTGDGLPDYIRKSTWDDGLHVRPNLGWGFGPEEKWRTPSWPGGIIDKVPQPRFKLPPGTAAVLINDLFLRGGVDSIEASSVQASYSIGFRAVAPIPLPYLFLLVGVGSTLTPHKVTGYELGLTDINGDGMVDHVLKTQSSLIDPITTDPWTIGNGEKAVWARINQRGDGNLLKEIRRPLGGSIQLAYSRVGNTAEDPQSRQVLAKVTVKDGVSNAPGHVFSTDVVYGGGRYDRVEREFLGFSRVLAYRDDRSYTEVTYRNDKVAHRGQIKREEFRDAEGRLWAAQDKLYGADIRVGGGDLGCLLTVPFFLPAAYCEATFTPLDRTEKRTYQPDKPGGLNITTAQEFDFDPTNGNVIELRDFGDVADATDDQVATIDYLTTDAASTLNAPAYPKKLVVRAGTKATSGTLLAERSAEYDARGGLKKLSASISRTEVADTELVWNTYGKLDSVTSPPNARGERYTIQYAYDDITHNLIEKTSDSFGYVSMTTWDKALPEPLVLTDINGNTTTRTVDEFGRVTAVHGPYDLVTGPPTISTTYAHGAAKPYTLTTNRVSPTSQIQTVVFLDGLLRERQTKKTGEVDGIVGFVVSGAVEYDALGRLARQSQLFFSTAPATEHVAPPTLHPTTFTYDVMGRQTTLLGPDGTLTTMTYDFGRPAGAAPTSPLRLAATVVDPESNERVMYRDGLDRVVALLEKAAAGNALTQYAYDPLGRMVSVRDAAGKETAATYDLLGRRTRFQSPETGLLELLYDRSGNLVSRVDPNLRQAGLQIRYEYEYNRLRRIDRPLSPDTEYFYGAPDSPENGAGRVVRIIDEAGEETRGYGRLGEMVRTTRTVAALIPGGPNYSFETRFRFDSFGRMSSLVYPDGEVLTYTYDASGLLKRAVGTRPADQHNVETSQVYVADIRYDAFGQRKSIAYGNGVTTSYEYDPRTRRLAMLRTSAPANPGRRTLQAVSYVYDKVGNITSMTNALGDPTNGVAGTVTYTYGYDELYRLTSATGETFARPGIRDSFQSTFTYSPTHDMLRNVQVRELTDFTGVETVVDRPGASNHDWTYVYGDADRPHLATQIGDTLLSYDANGNLAVQCQPGHLRCPGTRTGKAPDGLPRYRQFQWTEDNQLRAVIDNAGQRGTRFVYDAGGNRIAKMGAGGTSLTIGQFYSQRGRHFGTKHIFAGSQRVASRVANATGRRFEDSTPAPPGADGNENGCEPSGNKPRKCPPVLSWPGRWGRVGGEVASTYYYHPDHIGSTAWLTDQTGRVHERLEYFPFGEVWRESNEVKARGPKRRVPSYLFTGKQFDEETQLTYFGARYYDSKFARWTSPDPLLAAYMPHTAEQEPPGMGGVFRPANLAPYAYGFNNPLTYVDPTGMANQRGHSVGNELEQMIDEAADRNDQAAGVALIAAHALWNVLGFEAVSTLADKGTDASMGDVAQAGLEVVTLGKAGAVGKVAGTVGEQVLKHGGTLLNTVGDGVKAAFAFYQKNCRCFAAGTTVETSVGPIPIEEVEVGMWVLAKDPETGTVAWKRVTHTFVNEDRPLLRLSLVSASGQEETLDVTPEHPFRSASSSAWVGAETLSAGSVIATLDGVATVLRTERLAPAVVYNFAVEDFHTYYVGDARTWTHNSDPCSIAANAIADWTAKIGGRLDDLSKAAGAADRGGLTKAGRALEKHGSRPGSRFPQATGSVADKNKLGQEVVDDILTSPGATAATRHHARFGDVTEIRAPDGRGVRFDNNGNFIGFLEP